jgi:hypothetical protein
VFLVNSHNPRFSATTRRSEGEPPHAKRHTFSRAGINSYVCTKCEELQKRQSKVSKFGKGIVKCIISTCDTTDDNQ